MRIRENEHKIENIDEEKIMEKNVYHDS